MSWNVYQPEPKQEQTHTADWNIKMPGSSTSEDVEVAVRHLPPLQRLASWKSDPGGERAKKTTVMSYSQRFRGLNLMQDMHRTAANYPFACNRVLRCVVRDLVRGGPTPRQSRNPFQHGPGICTYIHTNLCTSTDEGLIASSMRHKTVCRPVPSVDLTKTWGWDIWLCTLRTYVLSRLGKETSAGRVVVAVAVAVRYTALACTYVNINTLDYRIASERAGSVQVSEVAGRRQCNVYRTLAATCNPPTSAGCHQEDKSRTLARHSGQNRPTGCALKHVSSPLPPLILPMQGPVSKITTLVFDHATCWLGGCFVSESD